METITNIATVLIVLILLVLIIFQSYWALGGTRFLSGAWGGKFTVLPTRLRVSSGFSVLLFTFAIALVLVQVEVWHTAFSATLSAWGTVAFAPVFLLSSLANFASRSKWERYLNGPSSLVLAALFLVISFNEF